jgi:hypothetical protein
MQAATKKYQTIGNRLRISYHTMIKNKFTEKHEETQIVIEGGRKITDGFIPGTLITSDEEVQKFLDNCPDNGVLYKEVPIQKVVIPKKGSSKVEKDASPEPVLELVKIEDVYNINEAAQFLSINHDIPIGDVNTKAKVIKKAKELNIEFVNL